MERGVVIGGLMIFGSFLLATLLNRSAMEEVPAPSPTSPVSVVAPISTPASDVKVAPGMADCVEAEARMDAQAAATEIEQPASARCVETR